ncbi:MAG: hypothetical protein JW709_14265, partial [Sedimentisphaerales bacterium]|nr:hypothetical protein [Sedimentisphaerales bacterium]
GAAIARLHCAGIVHHDLHAGNILIENACSDGPKNAYVTDLQSVTIQPRSGHASADPMHKDRQANLAVIIAALRHKLPQSTIKHLIGGYLKTIQPHQVMSDDKLQNYYLKLMTLARRHDARVMRARERRCLRNSRYARHIKLSDGWSAQVYLQYRYPKDEYLASRLTFTVDDWRNALAKPERLLTEGTVIKQGGHNTVREMELQIGSHSIPIIIKHTRVRSGLRGFWQALRRSRAMRQWLWAHALIMRDIPTAWPLAAMEHFRWGFIFESIFITEKIPDSQNLKLTLLENQNLPQKSRQRYDLCRKLGEILRNLDQFGLNHRDCKVSNILIQKTQDKQDNILWLPYLIDLDGLSRLYWLRYFRHYQTIIRLAASSLELDNITNRDRVAVFSGYILQNLQTKRVFRHPNSERERQLWRYLSRQARKRSGLEN